MRWIEGQDGVWRPARDARSRRPWWARAEVWIPILVGLLTLLEWGTHR